MNKSLLDKAYANLFYAREGLKHPDDEAVFDLVGYHIQQAVEVTIKYEMEMNGAEYAKMHNIRQLLQNAAEQGISLSIPEYIDDHAEMFTEWEARSRYTLDFKLELNRAEKGYCSAVEYFANVAREYEHGKFEDSIAILSSVHERDGSCDYPFSVAEESKDDSYEEYEEYEEDLFFDDDAR